MSNWTLPLLTFAIGWYVRHWFDTDWKGNSKFDYLVAAIRHRGRDEDDMRPWQRPLYLVKCIICMALNLRAPGWEKRKSWSRQTLCIGVFNISGPSGEYSSHDWDEARVGEGLFRNWYWEAEHDSSC